MAEKIRTAFLISGGGSTAEAVIKASRDGRLTGIEPMVVISSRKQAGGIAKAETLGVPTAVKRRQDCGSDEEFGQNLLGVFEEFRVDLISQNGWLAWTPDNVTEAYKGKDINQHPGPLDNGRPDFGGPGMYGSRVMASVLGYYFLTGDFVCPEATVHHAVKAYDEGQIINVNKLELNEDGLAELTFLAPELSLKALRNEAEELIRLTEELQSALLPIEHQTVIQTLQDFADGKVPTFSREEPLIPEQKLGVLEQAKQLTIEWFP